MKRIFFIQSKEEAKEKATQFLWENRKSDSGITTSEFSTENDLHLMEDEETGNIVFFRKQENSDYILYLLRGEEADPKNFTLPFRSLSKRRIFFPLYLGAIFYKPTRRLSFDEALTPEGAKAVFSYPTEDEVDSHFCTSRKEVETLTKEEVFETQEDEYEDSDEVDRYIVMKCVPLPSILGELTGTTIRNAGDYATAIEKLLETKLSQEEKETAKEYYNRESGELLLAYAKYEFARTENYSRLLEALSRFEELGLRKEWYLDTNSYLDHSKKYNTAEEEILSRYLATWIRLKVGGAIGLKDIAEATGTPYSALLKADTKEVWT